MLETDLREMDDGVGATDCDQQLLSGLSAVVQTKSERLTGRKKTHETVNELFVEK
jgi:hypothetical protein